MSFTLPALPYAKDALAPHLSQRKPWNFITANTTKRTWTT
jgi:superoxide dismutase